MAKTGIETLAHYVDRIMKEKGLSRYQVEVMSGGNIKDSYVGSIVTAIADNLSVEKLQALALGLGVDEDEIFLVARGKPLGKKAERPSPDPWYAVQALKLTEWILTKPVLMDSLQQVMKFADKDQHAVVDSIKEVVEDFNR